MAHLRIFTDKMICYKMYASLYYDIDSLSVNLQHAN